ncbi:MAG TPA: hypothetical protein VMZ22_03850 [Acidimicrobiales bacterium]|nr:hypothetical protein [Acidimicrobiales bacterium]
MHYWLYDFQAGKYTLDTARSYTIATRRTYSWGYVDSSDGYSLPEYAPTLDIRIPTNGKYGIYVQYLWTDNRGNGIGASDHLWTSSYTNYTAPNGYVRTSSGSTCVIQPGFNQAAYSAS